LALAAMFSPYPVRLAHDRYQQFQGGIKRHASRCVVDRVDRGSGKFRLSLRTTSRWRRPGQFSVNVATSARPSAIGIYDVPKVDVTTVPFIRGGVTADRCALRHAADDTALEALVDEVRLPCRLTHRVHGGAMRSRPRAGPMTAIPTAFRSAPLKSGQLEKHPIWQQRARQKSAAAQGMLVGTVLRV